jgi:RNA polymerase primary sigma factor
MKKFGDQMTNGQPADATGPNSAAIPDDGLPYLEIGDSSADGGESVENGSADGGEPVENGSAEDGEPAENGSAEAMDLLGTFLEELEQLPPLETAEEQALLAKAAGGDRNSKKRLAEGNLKYAMSFTKEFMGGDLSVEDLISETNLAVVKVVEAYTGNLSGNGNASAALSLREAIAAGVRSALKLAVSERKEQDSADSMIRDRANMLTEVSRVLAGELGRQPTTEELSRRMGMDEDAVREIMKMTMQAMEK